MDFVRRDIFLKIEHIPDYTPLAPVICSRQYGRDCMYSHGHETGRIPANEIFEARLDALVYHEYLDPNYTIPNKAKIIKADVNEPPWDRRVPGTVLYAKPGEQLYIHVLNADKEECHSLHLHGLKYGIDSDGAWPFGVVSRNGQQRSDEILPGERWTYIFNAMPETIGPWVFHDHVRNVQQNVNRGLFGGLIVRDPNAPCADHQIPLFIHQMVGISKSSQFRSRRLSLGETFDSPVEVFTGPEICNYYCAIHGPSMSGQVIVEPGGSADPNNPVQVGMRDNKFIPEIVTVGPGGKVRWRNDESNNHIVFAPGGGKATFCLNGRAYVGNTPTIVADSGEQLRWYLFNMDLGDIWHNFHPHSARWQLPVPPAGASDVHSLSPSESFVTDTEAPPVLRLPCILDDLQCNPTDDACRVRIKGDFLIHCHLEQHMMAGLAGLLRTREYIWINEEVAKKMGIKLPYDDGSNSCPSVDLMRCQPKITKPPSKVGVKQGTHHPSKHLQRETK
jgi:FtsP/CotA-like multicopper oxidase with cupredoxin domain